MTTKEEMKKDRIYADVTRFTKDKKIADALIAKYGVDCAYAIVRQCMQEPANVMKRINPKSRIWRTGEAIKWFAQAPLLTNEAVAKEINKATKYVTENRGDKNVSQGGNADQTEGDACSKPNSQSTSANKKPAANTSQPTQTNLEVLGVQSYDDWLKQRGQGWQPSTPAAPKKTIDEQVEDELARLKAENPNGVTFATLKQNGFTAGINERIITADKLKYLHAGKDGKGMGEAVKAATEEVVGKNQCGAAVRIGYTKYMNDTYSLNVPKDEEEFYGKRVNGKVQPGSHAAQTLYKKFDSNYFTVLTYQNEKANSALNNVPDGTTIFYEGKAGRKLASGSPHPGHTATYNATAGCWYAGHYCQTKAAINNGTNYGKHYRLAIANDTKVDDELLREIIREQIQQNEQNKTNQYYQGRGR